MMKFQRPKGTYDILPQNSYIFKHLMKKLDEFATFYGFKYIETPIIEKTELFLQSVGEETDIAKKEMYSFVTKGGDKLTLRPEGTAPVIRAYIENGLKVLSHPLKLYYAGPFFRHENPQRLRYREFRQFGFEILGSDSSMDDTEVIYLTYNFLSDLNIRDLYLKVNSVGCVNCRQNYLSNLIEYVKPLYPKLPKDAKERVKKNILKIFDLKDIKVKNVLKNAPQIIDFLCDDCKKNLEEVLDYLDFLQIQYVLDPCLVRGLDYYTKTVFEFYQKGEDAIALGGGGRYDFLIKSLGGPDHSATGIAVGIERVMEILKNGKYISEENKPNIFMSHLGELGRKYAFKLIEDFRKNNIRILYNFGKVTLKSQLKFAQRFKLDYTIICSQKELMDGNVIVKNNRNGIQKEVKIEQLISFIKDIKKEK